MVPGKRDCKDGASVTISGEYKTSEKVQKTKPWSKVDLDFKSGGLTEVFVAPRLGQYYNIVTGTAWFTELEIVEVGRARAVNLHAFTPRSLIDKSVSQ